MAVAWQALIAGALAGSVGLAELLGRYRSDPTHVLPRSVFAYLYVLINVGAGVAALLLITALNWTFGQSSHVDLWRILVAGFGAIAFFRSSFFVTRIGSATVNIGPSLVLGALLDACDREVDRMSAERMAEVMDVQELSGLDPASVMYALPVLSLALMQNFPAAEQAQLGAELAGIRNAETLGEQAKMRAILVQLAKYLSTDVVRNVLVHGREAFLGPAPVTGEVPSPQTLIEQARKELGEQPTEPPG